ncbi:MAG TPA: GGDEF domain-containing protein [Cellvibrionaceae bacterium]
MQDISSFKGALPLTGNLAPDHGPLRDVEAEARIRLAHALQTSLDIKQLVSLLFRHIQPLVSVAGISLRVQLPSPIQYSAGRKAAHSCLYQLNLPDLYLGDIQFYRKTRFSDAEQQTLEVLLTSFAFALKNAQLYQQALALALTDPLTGVGNRAALDNAIEREYQLLRRTNRAFALLMIDIDAFKQINDTHGHSMGDQVLCSVADTISDICRASDMVFRYGGEEFAVLLSATGAAGGLITAERLRRATEQLSIDSGKLAITPTISVGVSACCQADESVDALFERADRALYKAKHTGRNQVCCEPPAINCGEGAANA